MRRSRRRREKKVEMENKVAEWEEVEEMEKEKEKKEVEVEDKVVEWEEVEEN